MHRPRGPLIAVLLALSLAASACGGGTAGQEAAPTPSVVAGFPVTVEAANGRVTLESRPERIISLSPTATEMLFAIGAGEQVVAVDDQSDFPPEAPMTELSGYEPNVEAIAGYEPDLVVMADDPGELIDSLDALGIPSMSLPAVPTLDGSYEQIAVLGKATGNEGASVGLIDRMSSEIAQLVATVPAFKTPPTYYHELDDTYFSVTSDTFIGFVYGGLLGLENIADEAKGASSGYPQLSAEYIIDANPDFIFLADTVCCGQSAATLASRPGWESLSAVRDANVVELDDSIASRWGPRVVDFIRVVVAAVSASEPDPS
ncbi:MAG TPA: ABC transporter substrate-binding protein [Actinomycetota bacterium]|jgi:iron complex transport system substrate-binding protein